MVTLGDSGTFAQLYANLTGDSASSAWSKFQAAIQALPNGVTSDDPFNAFTAAAAPASIPVQSAPSTTEQPTKPAGIRLVPPQVTCPPKSKRLLPPKKRVH